MREAAVDREGGTFEGPGTAAGSPFERDYREAVELLRHRMNARYPPAYHERLSAAANPAYARGELRMDVVDAVSTAIAMALRAGANVEQAAEAGAASAGV